MSDMKFIEKKNQIDIIPQWNDLLVHYETHTVAETKAGSGSDPEMSSCLIYKFPTNFNANRYDFVKNCIDQNYYDNYTQYESSMKAKGAGIIPYTVINSDVYILLQRAIHPHKKKNSGWNDFGGKKNKSECTITTAAREFSEETSCLFYLNEQPDYQSTYLYTKLLDNKNLYYDAYTITELKRQIPISTKYFFNRINKYVNPINLSSKETYVSYIVKVEYVPAEHIPRAEDIHIPYETRYIRECRWFTMNDLAYLSENDFHKRLQITKIKNQLQLYYNRGLLE